MIKVAILDLYEGHPNQGMRCIREILAQFISYTNTELFVQEFDVRKKEEVPDLSYHIYISSGGPGSPLPNHEKWETLYFGWLNQVENWNKTEADKKHVFFICHSFQLASRHYQVAQVTQRKSTSFGVFPIHLMDNAHQEPVFKNLRDPFYVVDSRDYQVVQPNHARLREIGGTILCIEKDRPHVPHERAIMGIRFNQYFVGTQFHPEADAVGMSIHLKTEERKKTVIDAHGEPKWQSMIEQLSDPDKILYTHDHILPNFLNSAVAQIKENSGRLVEIA